MTAEIAVINRLAVALAADSAVTIGSAPKSKIYQSANKLFELSETAPVGLMIYNSASFFGVPWEVAIKEFRNTNATEEGLIFDWHSIFIDFLTKRFKPTSLHENEYFI